MIKNLRKISRQGRFAKINLRENLFFEPTENKPLRQLRLLFSPGTWRENSSRNCRSVYGGMIHKNILYKNIKAENGSKIKNILWIYVSFFCSRYFTSLIFYFINRTSLSVQGKQRNAPSQVRKFDVKVDYTFSGCCRAKDIWRIGRIILCINISIIRWSLIYWRTNGADMEW